MEPSMSTLSKFLHSVWQPSALRLLQTPLCGGLAVMSVYLLLVQILRFQRVRKLEKKYGKAPRSKDGRAIVGRPDVSLTPEEAQKIMLVSSELDMPGLMFLALAFALFKTYSIPTISEVLLKSRQLSTAENVARRYADTVILVGTWSGCPFVDMSRMDLKENEVDSRSAIAVARVNWLHARWPTIKHDDLLYTLALFISEPIRWAKTFGWRELLPIEQEAYFVFWREIGGRMNIKDIPKTLDGLFEWTKNYEEINMVPATSNYAVGLHTVNNIVRSFTERFGIRAFASKMVISLLEDKVCNAFMLPESSPFIRHFTGLAMSYFAIRHRYFSLPRIAPVELTPRKVPSNVLTQEMPRLHPTRFEKEPWYKPEPTGLGWLAQAVLVKIGVLEEEFIPSAKYKSAGYRLEECGPVALENVGHTEVMKMAAEIQGCPVTGAWACKDV